VLEQLGPAVNANKALFLYGSPGNGKTVIAEGLGRTIGGDMYMPFALDIDGQIITMYDPTTHQSLESDEPDSTSIIAAAPRDRRWIRVKRPVVMVGGELTLEMLDLTFNSMSKFYEAPIQLKANGGVFLVDDFGRQRVRPQELLNRWIVPLESRADFLTLHTGKKFQVPFDVLIVFATNLDPKDLADEAFLRRIPYKIPIGDPTVEQFTRIFELNCERRKMRFHQVMVAYLQRRHYHPHGRPLRACHPRDLLDQVSALCRYRGIEPTISRELLDAACAARPRPQPETVGGSMRLVIDRTRKAVATAVEVATTRRERRRGLLGRDFLDPAEGLILAPCAAIHTAFMRFPIDVVFLDRDGCAVRVVHRLKPWRIAVSPRAHTVVELAAGALERQPVEVGDRLFLAC
jgi:uncharacterized membrane protein (UPF0127 family)